MEGGQKTLISNTGLEDLCAIVNIVNSQKKTTNNNYAFFCSPLLCLHFNLVAVLLSPLPLVTLGDITHKKHKNHKMVIIWPLLQQILLSCMKRNMAQLCCLIISKRRNCMVKTYYKHWKERCHLRQCCWGGRLQFWKWTKSQTSAARSSFLLEDSCSRLH